MNQTHAYDILSKAIYLYNNLHNNGYLWNRLQTALSERPTPNVDIRIPRDISRISKCHKIVGNSRTWRFTIQTTVCYLHMPQMPYNEYGLLIAQAQFMAPVSSLTQQGSPNRSTRQISMRKYRWSNGKRGYDCI